MQSIRKERFLSDNNVGYSIIPLVGTALCSLLFFNQMRSECWCYSIMAMVLGLCLLVLCRQVNFNCLSRSDFLGLIVLSYLCLRALFQSSHETDWLQTPKYLCFVLLYVIGRQLHGDEIIRLLFVFIVLGVIEATIGGFQFLRVVNSHYSPHNVIGTLANSSNFGVFLSIACTSASQLAFCGKQKLAARVVFGAAALLMIIILIASKSRTAIIVVVVAMVAPFIRKRGFLALSLFVVAFLIMVVGLYFLRPESADARMLIWRVCLSGVSESLLFGKGIGSLQVNYMYDQAEYFLNNPLSPFVLVANNNYQSFNEPLHILYEVGIIGLVLFTLLFISILKESSDKIFAHVLALITASIFINLLDIPILACVFFLLCGASGLGSNKPVFKLQGSKGIICAVSLFIVVGSVVGFMKYRSFERSLFHMTPNAFLQLEDREREMVLHNKNYALLFAKKMNDSGEAWTMDYVERISKETITTCEMQVDLGLNYWRHDQWEKAEKRLILASNMIPSRALPLYHLLELYIEMNDAEKARKISKDILSREYKSTGSFVLRMKKRARETLSALDLS